MNVRDLVAAELSSGLARLEGTRIDVVVPLRQRVMDDLLPLVPGVPANVSVALGPERQVQVRYGSFHASARLHPEVTFTPVPVVTLTLSSQLVAFALGRLTLPPFVRLSGREVRIHLAQIPALADLTGVWPHVDRMAFTSLADGLEISVRLVVTADAPPLVLSPRPRVTATATAARVVSSPIGTWVRQQLATGLPAFAGGRASATVRAAVSLLTDVLAAGLAEAAGGEAEPSERAADGLRLDRAMVARLIRQVRVDAAPGVVTLDVEAGVDG